MSDLQSKLIYQGVYPVHTLAHEWTSGSYRTLDQLFAVWGEQCPVSNTPDENFANWFFNTYVQNLGSEWRFVKDMNDFTAKQPTPDPVVAPTPQPAPVTEVSENPAETQVESGSIVIESTPLETAGSALEAEKKLKAMRHQDTVGVIERTPPPPLQYSHDKATIAKNFPKPGTNVMTGDDLEAANSLKQSITHGEAVVIEANTEQGTVGTRPATPVDAQRELDNQLSQVNRRTKVLQPEELQPDGSRVQIITGDSFAASVSIDSDNPVMETVEQAETGSQTESPTARVNENFQTHAPSGHKREITVADIVSNPDEVHAKELIKNCKNSRILKIARNSCYNQGKMKLFEEINTRLQKIPPNAM